MSIPPVLARDLANTTARELPQPVRAKAVNGRPCWKRTRDTILPRLANSNALHSEFDQVTYVELGVFLHGPLIVDDLPRESSLGDIVLWGTTDNNKFRPEIGPSSNYSSSGINLGWELDPVLPIAGDLFPRSMSDNDKLLMGQSTIGPAGITPREIQCPGYIAQGLEYTPSWADLDSVLTAPLPTFPSADGENAEDLAQIFAVFGSIDANSHDQTLEGDSPDIFYPPTVTSTSILPISSPLAHVHCRMSGERSIVDPSVLSRAFTADSSHPDIQRRALLEKILKSPFYLSQEHEPRLDLSDAGFVPLMTSASLSLACNAPRKGSIYSVFVDPNAKACLFCDKAHRSIERTIGCVRKHLGHCPFACRGEIDGCNSCTDLRRSRFFTQSHLQDHINKQNKRDRCTFPNCNASVRIGGIRRHYESMHPSTPFPDMKAQRKRKGNVPHRKTGSSLSFSPY
ncbi:hypothetical protein FRB91_003215 [Serendipita sp. 411]|nr:hypothetical protein FRB91_003215 [Serendipita sp. 411]